MKGCDRDSVCEIRHVILKEAGEGNSDGRDMGRNGLKGSRFWDLASSVGRKNGLVCFVRFPIRIDIKMMVCSETDK